MELILIKDLPRCPKGRVFKQDVSGGFFHSISDSDIDRYHSYHFTKEEIKEISDWFVVKNEKENNIKFSPKGYLHVLSTDYHYLWDLIHRKYRVPAWILYTDKYDEPIYDLIEVKVYNNRYKIGCRGVGYESVRQNIDDFIKICQSLELQYLIPEIEEL